MAGILDLFRETFVLVAPTEAVEAVPDDPYDNATLEAALAASADVVITGDRHLLRPKSFRGVPMVSPADLLASLGMEPLSGDS